jgi:molybdopterin-biosynthesis enzyme MoeA-like protein
MTIQQGLPFHENHPDNAQRLQMGVFPEGAELIQNPYNRIPGFTCTGKGGGVVHFVPGFPVMAWPMVESVLDERYQPYFAVGQWVEQSVIVYGAMEATLTPLMVQVESEHPGVKVFSLPSVDHPEHGRHIDLGVKGAAHATAAAYQRLLDGLKSYGVKLGPESVRM